MKKAAIIIFMLLCVSMLGSVVLIDPVNASDLRMSVDFNQNGVNDPLSANTASIGPVKVVGRQLLVDFDQNGVYEPYFIKGIGYNPYPIGVFPSEWGLCEYCHPPQSFCQYTPNGDGFACSAAPNGGPCHPWGGQPVGGSMPYPNSCVNLFDRADVNLDRDFLLLQAMGVNTIRTWEKVTPTLLAKANEYGIKVIAGYWIGDLYTSQGQPVDLNLIKTDYQNYIHHAVQDPNYSSILFFAIGNENNTYYYTPQSTPPGAPMCYTAPGGAVRTDRMSTWFHLAQDLAGIARSEQGASYRPVAVVNGEINEIGDVNFFTRDQDLANVDIWGINVYRGNSFGSFFDDYMLKSTKPLWVSETGVDALTTTDFYTNRPGLPSGQYDPVNVVEDQADQANWMGRQWDTILSRQDIDVGVTFMEYSDEYWKGNVNPASYHWDAYVREHNNTGTCSSYPPSPLSGAMPDGFFNEEWFGIMQVADTGGQYNDMVPREVYYALKDRFACSMNAPYYAGPRNNKSCDGTRACCTSQGLIAKGGVCISSCSQKCTLIMIKKGLCKDSAISVDVVPALPLAY